MINEKINYKKINNMQTACDEYNRFLDFNNLPRLSADEIETENNFLLSELHKFINFWDENIESWD